MCCFSAGRGAEVRRTVTRGAVLSHILSLTLPHITQKERHTHTLPHKNTHTEERKKKKKKNNAHTNDNMETTQNFG